MNATSSAAAVEHEYIRASILAYLAAYDVHRAHIMGHREPTTGIAPFTTLVDQVMNQEPYKSARASTCCRPRGAQASL